MIDRPQLYYGLCEGGPFHGKHLAEARTVSPVAYEKKTGKYQGPIQTSKDPNIAFGEYQFDGKTWMWLQGGKKDELDRTPCFPLRICAAHAKENSGPDMAPGMGPTLRSRLER